MYALTAFLLLTSGTVGAQEDGSCWSVRPMAGMTVATLMGDDVDKVSSRVGWAGGVEAECRLSGRLSLSGGVVYACERMKDNSEVSYYLGPSSICSINEK